MIPNISRWYDWPTDIRLAHHPVFLVFYQQRVNEVTKALLSAPKLQFHFQACCKGFTDIYIYIHTYIQYLHIIYTGWWFGTFFIFHNIWDVILPIDELIFFRGVGQPPTSINRWLMDGMMYGWIHRRSQVTIARPKRGAARAISGHRWSHGGLSS